jgi:hypothetical protein
MFAENGLTALKKGKQLESQSFINFIGEERYQQLADFILKYIADLKLPKKRYRLSTCLDFMLIALVSRVEEHLSSSVMA